MSKCGRPICHMPAKSSCSICVREQYCSSNCQKLDWKAHKSMCPILKKLSTKLQPFQEVIQINDEMLELKKGNDVRILEHLLLYLEYQFGTKVGEKGDLFDAERYAQVTYGNLRDKKNGMDQESEEMAKGAYHSANVIYAQKGDLTKAEELSRESLRIRTKTYGSINEKSPKINMSRNLLAIILQSQGKFGDETRGLYECSLALSVRDEGPDGLNTAIGNRSIGLFYYLLAKKQSTVNSKRTQLLLAKFHLIESERIHSKIYGPTNPRTVEVSTYVTVVLRELLQIFEF